MILGLTKRITSGLADITIGTALVLVHVTLADRKRERAHSAHTPAPTHVDPASRILPTQSAKRSTRDRSRAELEWRRHE